MVHPACVDVLDLDHGEHALQEVMPGHCPGGGEMSACRKQLRGGVYALIPNLLYNTIQYDTIQYNTIQYNTIQYNTM